MFFLERLASRAEETLSNNTFFNTFSIKLSAKNFEGIVAATYRLY